MRRLVPELPEVETVRRGLNAHTCQQRICGGTVLLNRSLASPAHANDFIEGMQGQSIRTWHRRGKYLIAQLGEDDSCDRLGPTADGWLGVHLRMTGQLLWCHPEDPLEKHTRVRLFFEGDRELRFVDIRTFGRLWWVPPHTSPHTVMTGLLSLGPEPFSPEFFPAITSLAPSPIAVNPSKLPSLTKLSSPEWVTSMLTRVYSSVGFPPPASVAN